MNNGIKVFQNEQFGKVRMLDEDGKVLFNGKDVARALGFADSINALKQHCRWVVKRHLPHPQSPNKQIEMAFIPEGDVYRLITHSRLPAAEKFERWVFDEVLPTIRKQGEYVPDLTAVITQAVQAAVSQTIQALMPFILAGQEKATPTKRIRRRVTCLIDQLETPLKLEMEEMILDPRYGFVMISDYFRDRYGLLISKSSIGRYAQKLYDTVDAQENAGIR